MTLTPLATARAKSNPNGCGCHGSMCSQYTRLKMCVWPSTTTSGAATRKPQYSNWTAALVAMMGWTCSAMMAR